MVKLPVTDKMKDDEQFDKITMQANFSAILYLLTEQQAVIGRLLQVLLEQGTLTPQQIAKLTDISSGDEGLTPTYTQLYNRFAGYYLSTKEVLDAEELKEAAIRLKEAATRGNIGATGPHTIKRTDEEKGKGHGRE